MSAILLEGPAVEPITLTEAKAYLRVEHDDDDDLIGALIAGSRIHVEAQTRRALITQSWRIARDRWPDDGRLRILPAPLREIVAARVIGFGGIGQAIDVDAFTIDAGAAPALVSFTAGAMPAPGRTVAGIELDVSVGYGDTADAVPEPLRQAIRLLVTHWYENRAIAAIDQAVAHSPVGVTALIAPYRVLSL